MKSKGFTLIELVTIIVILGILSVVALPRFINLSQDAHDSVAHATFASFENAVTLYHSCWIVKSVPGHVKNLACFGAGDIDSTITGYPLGKDTSAHGDNGRKLTGDFCGELWKGLLDEDFKITAHVDDPFGGDTDIVYWYSAQDATHVNTHCYFNYITDNPAQGQENWQMRYYPATGNVIVARATLS